MRINFTLTKNRYFTDDLQFKNAKKNIIDKDLNILNLNKNITLD